VSGIVLSRPKYFGRQCDINDIQLQTLGCLTLFFTTVKIILIYQCRWGKSPLRRQGSKAKDQHGRGLDNLQKQVRRFYIYQKLKVPYF
jgi:hypothetical protein